MLPLFGSVMHGSVILTDAGKMIDEKLKELSGEYVAIDKYIVMPNHIHAIIQIDRDGTAQGPFPTLSELIRKYKTLTTKLYIDGVKVGKFPPFEKKMWQKSFYDHIIRNESSYLAIWKYIDENPLKWQEDEYYILNG